MAKTQSSPALFRELNIKMKKKKQIPEALRKKLSAAGKKGWKVKVAKAEAKVVKKEK